MCGETQMNQSEPNQATETDTLYTSEQSARFVMGIFVHHFKLLTGEALLTTKLSSIWYDKRKSQADLVKGVEYAKAQEWIIPLDEAFRLTEAGYQGVSE